MEKTWKPTVAGILSIVAGAFSIIGGIVPATIGIIGGSILGVVGLPCIGGLIAGVMATSVLLGIAAIVGGIYALKRSIWGLALAGAICSLFGPWFVLGILAIIFVAISKSEFQ